MSWSDIFVILHFALSILVAQRVIYARTSSSSSLAWLAVLFAFPYMGVLAYLLIGEPKLGRKRAERTKEIVAFNDEFGTQFLDHSVELKTEERFRQISRFIENESNFFVVEGNHTKLLHDTESIVNSLIQDIRAAKHCCLLEFYIIEASGCIEEVLEAVIEANNRGVKCLVLADWLGSQSFWRSPWIKKLREAGVQVTAALPVGLLKSLWVRSDLRNHRKILVVDYHIAYTGSFNLIDPKLFKQDSGVGEWVDAMVRCEGPIAQELAAVFYSDWGVENDENLKLLLEQLKTYQKELPAYLAEIKDEKPKDGVPLQVLPSQPGGDTYLIYDVLTNALNIAQKEVVITSPYFIPDEPLLNTLISTVKRGVDVTLIIPKKSDSRLVKYASRAYYYPLLQAGVRIHIFTKGLLHTKAIIIDQSFALFGTVNMDMRSFYLNLEVSLALYDEETVADVHRLAMSYLTDCEEVELDTWKKRGVTQRFFERLIRLTSPLL